MLELMGAIGVGIAGAMIAFYATFLVVMFRSLIGLADAPRAILLGAGAAVAWLALWLGVLL